MKINTHRFYRNREAVIKGAALFLLDAILIIGCNSGSRYAAICGSMSSVRF